MNPKFIFRSSTKDPTKPLHLSFLQHTTSQEREGKFPFFSFSPPNDSVLSSPHCNRLRAEDLKIKHITNCPTMGHKGPFQIIWKPKRGVWISPSNILGYRGKNERLILSICVSAEHKMIKDRKMSEENNHQAQIIFSYYKTSGSKACVRLP